MKEEDQLQDGRFIDDYIIRRGEERMAKCGIEKYDKLPARVGYVDVDYLRWELGKCLQKTKKIKNMLEKVNTRN